MKVNDARLVRLNPNVTYKTRVNAAIALDVTGNVNTAFGIACTTVRSLLIFPARIPSGVVIVDKSPDPAFYRKAE